MDRADKCVTKTTPNACSIILDKVFRTYRYTGSTSITIYCEPWYKGMLLSNNLPPYTFIMILAIIVKILAIKCAKYQKPLPTKWRNSDLLWSQNNFTSAIIMLQNAFFQPLRFWYQSPRQSPYPISSQLSNIPNTHIQSFFMLSC